MNAKLILIIAILVAAVLVVWFVLGPLIAPAVLQTTVTVIDTNGVPHTVEAGVAGALVSLNGIQISTVNYGTTFQASSSNYSQFTLLGLGKFQVGNPLDNSGRFSAPGVLGGTGVGLVLWTLNSAGVVLVCNSQNYQATTTPVTLNIGTKYDLGNLLYGYTNGQVVSALSNGLIAWASMNGCPGTGNFKLSYEVNIAVQAVGTGSLPQNAWMGSWLLPIVISTGSLSVTGGITQGTGALAPPSLEVETI